MTPYYADDSVTLYHGDMRQVLPYLDLRPDCVIADPPYGETSLSWDRWPEQWPQTVAGSASSMWCFGSMRMFLERRDEFETWKFGQDVVWEKHNGSGFAADRFNRVHEHAVHWYRGPWRAGYHATPKSFVGVDPRSRKNVSASKDRGAHFGAVGGDTWTDDGTRLARSVLKVRNMHKRAAHPTEKPIGILAPLVEYACPPGGLILDPFAGSGSTAVAARLTGRRTVLIEADERYCEAITRRLAQDVLPIGGPA